MLELTDIQGLRVKQAQDVSSLTLGDLMSEIQLDTELPAFQRLQLISQLHGMTGNAPAGTPLSTLTKRGIGGILGALIAKYFGLGGVGSAATAATAVAGFGLAPLVDRYLNPAPRPFPGYVMV